MLFSNSGWNVSKSPGIRGKVAVMLKSITMGRPPKKARRRRYQAGSLAAVNTLEQSLVSTAIN